MLHAFQRSVSGREGPSIGNRGHRELLYSPESSIGPHIHDNGAVTIAWNSHREA
jgi:hypothetical protein